MRRGSPAAQPKVRQLSRRPSKAKSDDIPWGSLASGIGTAVVVTGGGLIWYYLRTIGFPGLTQVALASGSGIASLVGASVVVTAALMIGLAIPAILFYQVASFSEVFGVSLKEWPFPSLEKIGVGYAVIGISAFLIVWQVLDGPRFSLKLLLLLCALVGLLYMRFAVRRPTPANSRFGFDVPAAIISIAFAFSAVAFSLFLLMAVSVVLGQQDSDIYSYSVSVVVLLLTSMSNGVVGYVLTMPLHGAPVRNLRARATAIAVALLLISLILVFLAPEGRFAFTVFEWAGVRYGPVALVGKRSELDPALFKEWSSPTEALGGDHVKLTKIYVPFDFGGQRLVCDQMPNHGTPSGAHCVVFNSSDVRIIQ